MLKIRLEKHIRLDGVLHQLCYTPIHAQYALPIAQPSILGPQPIKENLSIHLFNNVWVS